MQFFPITYEEMEKLIQAEKSGKKIQARSKELGGPEFHDYPISKHGINPDFEYKICPEPRTIWVNEYSNGLGEHNFPTKEEADNQNESSLPPRKFIEVFQ